MANKYVDQGLYPAYAASPAFGTCQDGDGTSKDAATSATVAINLNGFSAAAGNTLTIGGAVLTCVASGAVAANSQFNASSGSTLATNIAAAINAATASVPLNQTQFAGWRTNVAIKDFFFASVSGTTLNIQTRAGSALFNATSLFAAVSSGFTGGTINQQFSGGAGGAWAYFNSPAAWGSYAVGQYGVFAANLPVAGVAAGGDIVFVRSANRTITYPTNTAVSIQPAAMGSKQTPVTLVVDDGTEWPADGSTPTLTLAFSANSNTSASSLVSNAAAFYNLKAKQYASGQRNLVFQFTPNASFTLHAFSITINQPYRIDNVDFVGLASGTFYSRVVFTDSASITSGQYSTFSNCRFVWGKTDGNAIAGVVATAANGLTRADFIGCEFDVGEGSILQQTLLTLGQLQSRLLNFIGCSFKNFPAGSRLGTAPSSILSGSTIFQFNFVDCSFGGLSDFRPLMNGATSSAGLAMDIGAHSISISSSYNGHDFMLDSSAGYAAWISGSGYPYNNAKLYDGITGWSLRMVPTATSGSTQTTGALCPLKGMPFSKVNSIGTDGVRTITMEYVIEKTLAATYTAKDVSLLIQYQDAATGQRVAFSTYDPAGAALTASSTIWEYGDVVDPADSVSRIAFVENGTTMYHSHFKFVVSTPTAVKAGTEIRVWPQLHSSTIGTSVGLFFDPGFTVT